VKKSILLIALAGCGGHEPPRHVSVSGPVPAPVADAEAPLVIDAGQPAVAIADAAAVPVPTELHQTTLEGLLSLFVTQEPRDTAFLERTFGPDGPTKMNQGNKAIARHLIDREKCLAGLRENGVTVQTPEQRTKCGGFENMVPVWKKGEEPSYCIDIFEFPNKTCELPMVWTPPTSAKKVCELQGKRLCSDIEWNLACRGDPDGGADRRYAYGDKLDLDICNTNLKHRTACDPRGPATAWGTCSTDTEPSGSYPRCRSRFGVFDQHGNIAEVMTRKEGTQTVTQLKGSAWFYVELAKEPGQPPLATTMMKEAAYPDHCNFDPRWHVEPIDQAIHTNYHLGFRCCRSIAP
jgi:hypothetical protein